MSTQARWPVIAVFVAALVLALAACGSQTDERVVTASSAAVPAWAWRSSSAWPSCTAAAPGCAASRGAGRRFTSSCRDSVAHSLAVALPSGQRSVAATDGVDAVLSITVPEPGEFRLFCLVPGHSEEGVLSVTP